jgi:hypothetical protein
LFLALPVAFFFRRSFVVLLLAFPERDLAFNVRPFPVEGCCDAGTSLRLGRLKNFSDFFRV